MESVTTTLQTFFILTTLLTVYLFYRATSKSITFLVVVLLWMLIQMVVGCSGFYTVWDSVPPRFVFLPLPPLVAIFLLLILPAGRRFLDTLNIADLTILHTIRVPVEIALYLLFVAKTIPEVMTFEGRNFDILAGLSAPVVYYFGFVRKQWSNRVLVAWNVLCLGLLANIVTIAVLSAKTPLQQFGWEQPNIAIAYFPFVWLPGVVVPLVMLAHVATIRRLIFRSII